MQLSNKLIPLALAILSIALGSCSTTRRLGQDDILYTGVKKIDIAMSADSSRSMPSALVDEIKAAVNVKPNNSLISPYVRWPFPVGLWVYNNFPNPPHGFKHWIYSKLAADPVLISDVRPQIRTHMIEQLLDNQGYFRGTASYKLVQGHNPKKARISYTVTPGPAYTLDSIQLLPDTCRLYHLIDSVCARSHYLHRGARYSVDSLAALRVNIVNCVRNRGYYFFTPTYIEYLADSTAAPQRVDLRITVAKNVPEFAMQPYKVGKITATVRRNDGDGHPDTMLTSRAELVFMQPMHIRRNLIASCIAMRPGRTFTISGMDRTQAYLSRLGIFSGIDITPMPDSADRNLLNVSIDCTLDKPIEASIEVNVTSKSNSYLGPGLQFGLTHHNLFGGAEQLSVTAYGAYEWQTGRGRNSLFNSYEAGANATLAFPRLLAPRFIPRSRRELNWTRLQIGFDLLNRPHYFNMAQFNAAITYDWQLRRYVTNSLTLFKLTYTNLMHTTHEFDSIMGANPAIAQSFRSQFIPQMQYTYTYDRTVNADNQLNWTFTLQQAGNIFWGIYRACGIKGEKRLFGNPFSQFVKGQTQLVWNRRLYGDNWLVSRVAVGAAHAYGNSATVPYSEQFYVGGANSIRAFTVRSLGPGSYRVPADQVNGYFDQTGTFKFEFNVEYRFPIIGPVHGALFFDSGNVWLLRADPQRPGGLLQARSFLRDIATGTGAGLRLDLGVLVVRGDLGIGIHAPYHTSRHGYYNMESFGKSLAFHLAIGYPF